MRNRERFLRPTVLAAGPEGHPQSPSSPLRVDLTGVGGGHLSKTVLEVPLELNAGGAVSPRRHGCTTELRCHNDFSNELFIEEVTGNGRYPQAVTAYGNAQASDAVAIHFSHGVAGRKSAEEGGRHFVRQALKIVGFGCF